MTQPAQVFVCLLRGINVGGRNAVKMADLRAMLSGLGFTDVRTYIQSGNAVFGATGEAADVATAIEEAFAAGMAFTPRVLVLPAPMLETVVDGCPYAEAARDDPKKVHAFFLRGQPSPDAIDALRTVKAGGGESWEIADGVLYLHPARGLGRSKLAAAIERKLDVPTTARNWRSVEAILQLSREAPSA